MQAQLNLIYLTCLKIQLRTINNFMRKPGVEPGSLRFCKLHIYNNFRFMATKYTNHYTTHAVKDTKVSFIP